MRFALGVVLLAACQSRSDLDLLDQEMRRFKAENEDIRVEDLEARFARQKARAERLSEQLLELAREREARYLEYDQLKRDIAKLRRDSEAAARQKAALLKSLQKLQAELAGLEEQVGKGRKAAQELEQKNRAAQAGKAEPGKPAKPGKRPE